MAQEGPLVVFCKVLGCCSEESSRGLTRTLPSPPSLSSLPKPPEHGEGGGAVGDAHRGLRRVLPDPAHADHHLRLRVEVVSSPGGGGRGGAAGVTPHPFNPKCLPAPASRWPLAGALNLRGPQPPGLAVCPATWTCKTMAFPELEGHRLGTPLSPLPRALGAGGVESPCGCGCGSEPGPGATDVLEGVSASGCWAPCAPWSRAWDGT